MKVALVTVLLSVGVISFDFTSLGIQGLDTGAIAASKSLVAPTQISEPTIVEPVITESSISKPVEAADQPLPQEQDRPTVVINQPTTQPAQALDQSKDQFKDQINQKPDRANDQIQQDLSAPESATVVLENRSNGCSAADRSLDVVQGNLCVLPPKNKPEAIANTMSGTTYPEYGQLGDPSKSYGSYQFSGIRATVHPLARPSIKPTWTKIALPFNWSISLPLFSPQDLTAQLSGAQDFRGESINPSGRGSLVSDRQMIFPLSIPAMISSSFGYRIHPISGAERFHQGTDIAASEGTPVLAAYSGKVEISGWLGGLGLAIIISHEGDRETRYGHLSELFVQPGQWVEQGTAIGLVGSTGMSTGPHLHFELWQKQLDQWVATDPAIELNIALTQLNRFLAQELTDRSRRSKPNPA